MVEPPLRHALIGEFLGTERAEISLESGSEGWRLRIGDDTDLGGSVVHAPDNDEVVTLTDDRMETNFLTQTVVSQHRYEHWRQGKLVGTERELFSLRWWGVAEFAMALRETGFVDVVASGNYQYGRAPQKDDGTISFEARRSS